MSYLIAINGDKMKVIIDYGDESFQKENIIGEQLLDFAYYDLTGKLMDFLSDTYRTLAYRRNYSLTSIFKPNENTYVSYIIERFVYYYLSFNANPKKGFKDVCDDFLLESENLREDIRFKNVNYRNATSDFFMFLFSAHAFLLQKFVRSHFEFCMNSTNNKLYSKLTPTQRLYVYEQWRKQKGEIPLYFEKNEFPTTLSLDREVDFNGTNDIDEMASIIKDINPNIAQMTKIENGYELMRYELMQIVTQNVQIKSCSNCSKYFIPEGRTDIEYCNRPSSENPDKTCQQIGALAKYHAKVQCDPIYKEFQKAYKRQNSRFRNKGMSAKEFSEWSEKARELREKCLMGNLSQKEYFEWLNQDRIYKRH